MGMITLWQPHKRIESAGISLQLASGNISSTCKPRLRDNMPLRVTIRRMVLRSTIYSPRMADPLTDLDLLDSMGSWDSWESSTLYLLCNNYSKAILFFLWEFHTCVHCVLVISTSHSSSNSSQASFFPSTPLTFFSDPHCIQPVAILMYMGVGPSNGARGI